MGRAFGVLCGLVVIGMVLGWQLDSMICAGVCFCMQAL